VAEPRLEARVDHERKSFQRRMIEPGYLAGRLGESRMKFLYLQWRGEGLSGRGGSKAVAARRLLRVRCAALHAPLVEGERVVHTNVLNGLDLETGLLDLLDIPVERGGGGRAREDVTVH